jgi:hypothetical protein
MCSYYKIVLCVSFLYIWHSIVNKVHKPSWTKFFRMKWWCLPVLTVQISKTFEKKKCANCFLLKFCFWYNQLFHSCREVTRAQLARTITIRKPLKEAGPAQSVTTWTIRSARCATGKDARTASQPRRITEPNLAHSAPYCWEASSNCCTRRLYLVVCNLRTAQKCLCLETRDSIRCV